LWYHLELRNLVLQSARQLEQTIRCVKLAWTQLANFRLIGTVWSRRKDLMLLKIKCMKSYRMLRGLKKDMYFSDISPYPPISLPPYTPKTVLTSTLPNVTQNPIMLEACLGKNVCVTYCRICTKNGKNIYSPC
jgi:hypothetical protein